MRHVSYSAFREHLAQYMDEVCDSCAALHVTRQNARTVVLLSEDERHAGDAAPSAQPDQRQSAASLHPQGQCRKADRARPRLSRTLQ
jgi:hypothetical protein